MKTLNIKKYVKHACYGLVAAVAMLVGCQSIPSADTIHNLSLAVGYSTGMVCNMTKIDDASRNAICEIVEIVSQCTPATNETFEVAWTPVAKAHTQKLIDEGKIDAKQGELIMTAFTLVTKGIDYLFEVRYPKAKEYKDLVVAGIDGFTTGFLTVFKPVNAALGITPDNYDADTFNYLLETTVR